MRTTIARAMILTITITAIAIVIIARRGKERKLPAIQRIARQRLFLNKVTFILIYIYIFNILTTDISIYLSSLVNIFLEGNQTQALGFIQTSPSTLLRDVRKKIMDEIEDCPSDFRFLNGNAPVSVKQEQSLDITVQSILLSNSNYSSGGNTSSNSKYIILREAVGKK